MLPLLFLCKGALTSKPYSFVARPWEFKSVESVDFLDSTVSSIRLDLRGDRVLRVLPRINDNVNEEWISDRIRFSVDGFRSQRVDRPLAKVDQHFHSLSWSKFMNVISRFFLLNIFNKKNLDILSNVYNSNSYFSSLCINRAGVFNDLESSLWLNLFQNTFFLKMLPFSSKFKSSNARNSFYIPIMFKDFFKIKNILLISINPRFESPVLNIRLRQSVVKFGSTISSFGQNFYSNFTLLLNSGIVSLVNFMRGNHWLGSTFFLKDSLILAGAGFNDSINFLSVFNNNSIIGSTRIGIFNRYSSSINLKEAGIVVPQNSYCFDDTQLPFFEILVNGVMPFSRRNCKNDDAPSSVITLAATSHGVSRLTDFDFILPVSAPFERNSIFLNLEGRAQLSRFVLNSPNNVLDLKDSLIILFTLLINSNSNKFDNIWSKFIVLIASGIYTYSLLNTRLLWVVIHRMLGLFAASRSFFLKDFFANIVEYVNKSTLVDLSFNESKISMLYNENATSLLLKNRNSGESFETVENFYTQDEISLSSFSILSANDRLVSHQTYF